MDTFGERVSHARRKRKISVKALAAKCRVHQLEVIAWERMETADCTGTQLAIVSIVLGASMLWLSLGIGTVEPAAMSNMRRIGMFIA